MENISFEVWEASLGRVVREGHSGGNTGAKARIKRKELYKDLEEF